RGLLWFRPHLRLAFDRRRTWGGRFQPPRQAAGFWNSSVHGCYRLTRIGLWGRTSGVWSMSFTRGSAERRRFLDSSRRRGIPKVVKVKPLVRVPADERFELKNVL